MAQDREKKTAQESVGPELRLVDRRALVGFPSLDVAPGLVITDFALQIPDVTFPFNLSGGASRYQKKRLQFGLLELQLDAELVARRVNDLAGRLADIEDLKLHFRPGYLEGQARLTSGERAAFTFKVAFDGDGEKLAVYLYDVRLYGFATTPAPQISVLLARGIEDLALLPGVERRGASGFSARILPPLVELAAVSRGYKVPNLDQARLSAAEVSSQGLRLRFSSGGLPPPATPDEELLLSMEGARAFADAESLLAGGKLAEARAAYLKLGDAYEAHPFAAERLLALLVADPQAHELALDLAASLASRRERSATALWAEAVVRERRGEHARASERYLALCALARKNHEDASAFFAAESAARASRDHAPQMAVKALHELLGLKPDHLPSLKQLARAADQANDRAGAIRAYRRIAALARDPADAAEAHVQMARLCAVTEDDIAGARLHCEAALKLAPDHPDALYLLGDLCHRAGEHLRALKALDRLREVALGRHELDRVGRANLLAGKVWETGLSQPENALLRYREAVSLMPGDPEPLFYAARAAEGLGHLQEAVAGYQQTIELAGPAPRSDDVRRAAHRAHHAMARLSRTRLGDPARAHEHLQAALGLDPRDMAAIEELLPYFRAGGRAAELADALEKAAAVTEAPERRAAFWAEAGELYRGRLGKPDKAERLLSSALEADGRNQMALEGMLALAESRRDGGQLCRCLKALAELAQEPQERVRYFRRLAVAARDLAFDLDLAAQALAEVIKLEPEDLPALGELCGLQRRRADMNGLAHALELRARAAEAQHDKRLASAALRELAQVLEARLGRVGEALVALEKAARLSPEPQVLLELADLSLRCERPEHARRALEDLLQSQHPTAAPERLAEIRARLGRACEMLGDKDGARQNYAEAFPLRRLDEQLGARLEALYSEAGAARELAELWSSRAQALLAAERAPEAGPLFLKAGRAFLALGDKSAAVLRLNAALDATTDDAQSGEVLDSLAQLELDRGAKGEAAKLLARKAALTLDTKASARLYFRAASLAAGTSRESELLAQALNQDERLVPARIRRAELVLESDPSRALADLEAVLELPPGEADVPQGAERLSLSRRAGLVALKAGRTDAARRHLAFYSASRPEDVEVQKELAALHRRASAREPLADLLAELWPHLVGAEQRAALRELAELSLALGRRAAAVEALRALFAADPSDREAAQKLLGLTPDDADGDEPLSLVSALLDGAADEERADLLVRRSRLHRRAGHLDRARDDLAEAARTASHPGALLRELAELARATGDEAAEIDAWRIAAQKEPGLSAEAAPRLLALARARLTAKDAGAAQRGFEAASSLPLSAPERQEAFAGLAEACLLSGDDAGAAAALLEASREGPPRRRADALLRRAGLLETAGDVAGAGESYSAALAVVPRDEKATAGLKRALRVLEDWEALAEVLTDEAAVASQAKAAPLYAELGELYLARLELKGPAEAALRRAAQLDKGNVRVRQSLVTLLADRGDLAEMTQLAEEAAASLPPAEAATLLRDAAFAARARQELELALRLLRRANALAPATGEALEELAELLYLRGAVAEALPIARTLAKDADFSDAPDRAEALFLRLADLAEQSNDAALAEKSLRRVLKERPLNLGAAQRLSKLLARTNPRESVQVLWAHAQERGPSDETVALLLALAERARTELLDVELSSTILRRATEVAPEPLALHRALADLYREAGRTQELGAELLLIAEQCFERGDTQAAIDAYGEQADLSERAGRVDDALKSLLAIRELCEDEGEPVRAAAFERRRAELLRDAKLDLGGAQAALDKSFELHKSLETARAGAALAHRRNDAEAEADWLERSVDLLVAPKDRARALLELAALFDGPLRAPHQAEAALTEALRLDPSLDAAEARLVALLEREGRPGELAAYFEESAQKATEPQAKTRLLLRAARLYRDHANRPDAAAAALLAARAASPDDADLTAQCADLLFQMGRASEAAEFDAVLLEADPFRARIFERHAAFLKEVGDDQALATLMLRRAEKQSGADAAESYLEAAGAFRRAGAEERAHVCEDQAFESAPGNDEAFEALHERRKLDPRRLAELLERRAEAVPAEAPQRLRERADVLLRAGETLQAAEAFDALLEVAGEDIPALSSRAELAAEAGGPLAAQPYDRRLLAAGGDSLPAPVRVRSNLRLGHASLNSGAYRDAADALEAVVALDPDGPKGQEALSLLAEVHARTQNTDGLYRTSLALAGKARPDEAEALLRRAAELFEDPKKAIDALIPLARLRPADAAIVERAAQGLKSLGRHGELVELLERSAEASGGPSAAESLLEAARICHEELKDEVRARALQKRAEQLDPDNLVALRAVALDLRQSADLHALKGVLERLVQLTQDLDEASEARLELADLVEAEGDDTQARSLLEAVVARGPSGAGYAQALESLTPLLQRASDDLALAQNFAARAELSTGPTQSELLLSAARHYERAGQDGRAVSLARASVSNQASAEGLILLAQLWRRQGQPGKAAAALVQAAQLSPTEARGPLLVEAAEAWEAAGEPTEAREVVERLATDYPGLLSAEELSRRLAKLGSAALALETGFGPAMAAGDFRRALTLAEEAKDAKREREALWALVSAQGDVSDAGRLADALRANDDTPGLLQLAHTLERASSPTVAASIYEGLAFADPSPMQAEALARLLLIAESDEVVLRAVGAVTEQSPRELVELVVEKARALPALNRVGALEKAAGLLPGRRSALLREVADLHLAARAWSPAAETLEQLLAEETSPATRAALQLELGELCLKHLEDAERARGAFEHALAEEPGNLTAAQHLLGLYAVPAQADRFAAVAERVIAQLGTDALGARLETLADAYEALERRADAGRTLALLPESPELLRRRAALSLALGLPGEALQLRERVAQSRDELEEILVGYLKAGLVPFALKLAERLLEEGPLAPGTTRLAAERLAASVEGPALAARLWPALLAQQVADADGWTLFAEALRRLERTEAATIADGFGAALTASGVSAPPAPIRPLARPEGSNFPSALPVGLVAVSASSMPRLHAALGGALTSLGAERVRIFLHPGGGVEAYLGSRDELVLGAGALGAFGPVELTFLCAVALALGDRGHALSRPGAVEGFEEAAQVAFAANPASLAAARVLAQLDTTVRGGDPLVVDTAAMLKSSAAFRAVALRALELLQQ